jgi:hypothetical protein
MQWISKGAVDQLERALGGSDTMAPSEIFDVCCDFVAGALDLATAVVIERFNGVPSSISWKATDVDENDLLSAEHRAWAIYEDHFSPDPCSNPPPAGLATSSKGRFESETLELTPPLHGILHCGTLRPLNDRDRALLRYMAGRFSFALYRYEQQWERPWR